MPFNYLHTHECHPHRSQHIHQIPNQNSYILSPAPCKHIADSTAWWVGITPSVFSYLNILLPLYCIFGPAYLLAISTLSKTFCDWEETPGPLGWAALISTSLCGLICGSCPPFPSWEYSLYYAFNNCFHTALHNNVAFTNLRNSSLSILKETKPRWLRTTYWSTTSYIRANTTLFAHASQLHFFPLLILVPLSVMF